MTLGRRNAGAAATDSPTAARLHARAVCEFQSSIIYPLDPYDVQTIIDYLKDTKISAGSDDSWWKRTKQVQGGAFTAFFFVEDLKTTVLEDILRRKAFLKACCPLFMLTGSGH